MSSIPSIDTSEATTIAYFPGTENEFERVKKRVEQAGQGAVEAKKVIEIDKRKGTVVHEMREILPLKQ